MDSATDLVSLFSIIRALMKPDLIMVSSWNVTQISTISDHWKDINELKELDEKVNALNFVHRDMIFCACVGSLVPEEKLLFSLRKRTIQGGLHGIYVRVFYNLFIFWTNWCFSCNALLVAMRYPSTLIAPHANGGTGIFFWSKYWDEGAFHPAHGK